MQHVAPAICIGAELRANNVPTIQRWCVDMVFYLQQVLTLSSENILMVQYDISTCPLVRIVPLNAYYVSFCPRWKINEDVSDNFKIGTETKVVQGQLIAAPNVDVIPLCFSHAGPFSGPEPPCRWGP